ncbi:MAG: hypothetical protein H7263_13720 [Candidatus Sericytochromatia bacterium]|nr:hypothetical protein [Candidatus Sericytochromatia bacterium]
MSGISRSDSSNGYIKEPVKSSVLSKPQQTNPIITNNSVPATETKSDSVNISTDPPAKGAATATLNFVDETDKSNKTIKITNYTNGLPKETQIQLFKDDIARGMKTEVKNITFSVENDHVVVKKKNSDEKYIVEFEDPKDAEKIVGYAKETVSPRLQDFGIKKHEGVVTSGFTTNVRDPKQSSFNQSFSYGTYIGTNQRIIVSGGANAALNQPFTKNNVNDLSITYQNLDLPFIGNYGEVKLGYSNGKFKVDGNSETVDLKVDQISKKYVDNLKSKDTKTLLYTGAGVLAVGAGLLVARNTLKDEIHLDAPIKTSLYSNGSNTIKAIVSPTLNVGGGHLGVSLHKAGIESEQNISSGVNAREKVIYDFEKKETHLELEANYNRTYLRANTTYSKSNPNDTKGFISVGNSHVLSDKVNLSYGYSQEFDKNFKSSNQSLNVGVEYNPSEKWRINAGAGAYVPSPGSQTALNLGMSASYRF